ncbi:hypothetical protein [Yinghuangia soli]|uniref:Uncharacterized protein n=1 Tax=Yinghuangia soli TaxID=2908204 RepID=A0AA41PX98_9ACTN|nr:hypothetical protein [Yinghuangia soli]MCF2527045.1 hypothetical protein [Yinghuangia soli]
MLGPAAATAGVLVLTVLLGACGTEDPRKSGAQAAPSGSASAQPNSAPGSPGQVAPAGPTGAYPSMPAFPASPPAGGFDAPWPGSRSGDPVADARKAAAAAADTWTAAHPDGVQPQRFTVTDGSLPAVIGTSGPQEGTYKTSLSFGCVKLPPTVAIPPHPTHGEVRLADGTVLLRPFVEPDAVIAKTLPPPPGNCGAANMPWLTVSSIKLTTATAATLDGQATVPVWEASFAETTVTARALAVTSDPRATPLPYQPYVGPEADSPGVTAQISADGRTVTLSFMGSPDGPGPCGMEYLVEAAQRDKVVAVVIAERPRPTTATVPANAVCTLIGANRTASVTLDAPLGDRALIGPSSMPVAHK